MKGKAQHPERRPAKRRSVPSPSELQLERDVEEGDPARLQRAVADPGGADPREILELQGAYGNRAVNGLLAGNARSPIRPPTLVQRQEEEEELQAKPLVQRQEEEEEIQAKLSAQHGATDAGWALGDETAGRIRRARGGGEPLDETLQAQMGEALGHDFSGVRVHTGAEADALNRQLSARAFTSGEDVFFRQGTYDPSSSGGQELVAHELSHVAQQSSGRIPGGEGGMTVRPAGDAFEQEADARASHAVTAGHASEAQVDGRGLQRQRVAEEAKIQREQDRGPSTSRKSALGGPLRSTVIQLVDEEEIKEGRKEEARQAKSESKKTSWYRKTKTLTVGTCKLTVHYDLWDSTRELKEKAVTDAITQIQGQGFALPDMEINLSRKDKVRCVAFMGDEKGNRRTRIFLGPKITQVNDMVSGTEATVQGGVGQAGKRGIADQIYDQTKEDQGVKAAQQARATAIVVHELGHMLHEMLGEQAFWEQKLLPSKKQAMPSPGAESTDVSHYATENRLEFVAEVFTGLMHGIEYGKAVLQKYKAFGGPLSDSLKAELRDKYPDFDTW